MFDVTALGEILIDFTQIGESAQGNPVFERNPGGAPANVLSCLAKFNLKTAFIGKVGDDLFGRFLIDLLQSINIDARAVRLSSEARTTLAFVQLDKNGDRSFSFYRNPGADTTLSKDELDFDVIDACSIFHFGSLSLTDEPARGATFAALNHARKNGKTISYDPNLRPLLWNNLDEAKKQILSAMHFADILKISEEELEFLTGKKNLEAGSKILADTYSVPLIFVTLGTDGAFFRYKDETGRQPAFTALKAVDTTGAGDSFLGGILYSMISRGIIHTDDLSIEIINDSVRFACAVAGLCTTKRGAIPAMPVLDDVYALLKK
jgi:fructokinase